VLSGHTDVVPVAGQKWTSDPFKMVERDGLLYGRGTADMKGFIACALAYGADMTKRDLKTPIHFALSYDEEVGCIGVKGLIADMAENLPLPRAVIVGEPTSMQLIGGNKGGRSFTAIVRGVPGHSSEPGRGANAIMAAARFITYIEDLQQEFCDNADPDCPFDPPYTTFDLGLVNGGTAGNIIPGECQITWGFRMLPDDDSDAIEARIRAYAEAHIDPPLKKVSADAGIEIIRRVDTPPLRPDTTSPAEQIIRHLTGLNQSGVVSYGTEAGHFQNAGVPGVIFGPGSIQQAHQPDEFIAVEQIDKCRKFIGQLLDWAETGA
jgi:acetylornithine deacetylase